MSTAAVGKTLHHIVENIVNVFKEGANLTTNYSDAAYDKWKQDAANVFKDTGSDSAEEAKTQAKEGLTKHLMDGGMSKSDAEKWFEARWKDALDGAEKLRKTAPKVADAAQMTWKGFLGAVTAIFTGAVIFSFVHNRPSPDQLAMRNLIQNEQMQQEQIQRLSQIMISQDDFNIMTGSLLVQSAPEPTKPPDPPAAMPAPIQAIAAEPAQVEVETPSGTQEVTTTVEQVYRSAPPQVQRAMESTPPPPPIEHDYDQPIDTAAIINQVYQHKDYTVSDGVGDSIHVEY
ncbi:MAG: hypothetical protein ABSH19_03485 [Opitutales bacterium]|jgi:hypothetical protein